MVDSMLLEILQTLLRSVKSQKLALAINCPEGDPLRPLFIVKIEATAKAARGLAFVMKKNGNSRVLHEGLSELIAAVEQIIARAPTSILTLLYAERASIMILKSRLEGIDLILAMPETLPEMDKFTSGKKDLAN